MTELGESVAVSTVPASQFKEFKAEVIEVTFADGVKAAHDKSQITEPHWPAPLHSGRYSQKPAVYPFGSGAAQKVEVKIKIESTGYSGNGKLTGVGANMEFEGQVPLSSGEHTVEVKMQSPPTELAWLKGQVSWGIDLPDMCASAGTTFLELFFVFDDPSARPYFSSDGVWAEALRFLFLQARPAGISTEADALASVTRMCFGLNNHKYDISRGAPSFGGASGTFLLEDYMSAAVQEVNCYDQAYAVIVFAGALGLVCDGIYINPFGFLATTTLVGYGRCNNPFPRNKYMNDGTPGTSPEDYLLVSQNDPYRAPFGNHMFCEFSQKIYDACAGPVTGAVDRAGYVGTAIDSSTTLYSGSRIRAGTEADMVNIASMGRNVTSVA